MSKETKFISQSEVVTILSNYEKKSFINVVSETLVRMNKTGNPYYNQVKKHSSRNYYINSDYVKRVFGNGEKEGISKEENTFEVENMKGKDRVKNSVCIDTKTQSVYYIFLELFDEVPPKVEYTFEGNPIDKHIFESYLVKVSESKKQPQERKVKVITPKIENIKSFTLEGVKYIVQ
jgi:hypothetical protein